MRGEAKRDTVRYRKRVSQLKREESNLFLHEAICLLFRTRRELACKHINDKFLADSSSPEQKNWSIKWNRIHRNPGQHFYLRFEFPLDSKMFIFSLVKPNQCNCTFPVWFCITSMLRWCNNIFIQMLMQYPVWNASEFTAYAFFSFFIATKLCGVFDSRTNQS